MLEAKEICKIIKEAYQSGVKSLKIGDLSVEFHEALPQAYYPAAPQATQAKPSHKPIKDADILSEKFSKESLGEESARITESKLEQLLINDPVAYEQLQLSEDFLDAPETDRDWAAEPVVPGS